MAVPTFHEFMLPILRYLGNGRSVHWRELRDHCVARFRLTEQDRADATPGGQSRLDNRILWANTYLFQAALVDRPSRGQIMINDRGRELLRNPPAAIDLTYLERYPEYLEFRGRTRATSPSSTTERANDATTPSEDIATAVAEATAAVRGELLHRVQDQPPAFLEQLVVTLLKAMGYGGQDGAVERTGRSHDGGLDGVIRQDALGLDRVYLQVKRYTEQKVGRPELQAFVGALHGAQAERGVFITTSQFTQEARAYVEHIPNRIILIDGARLAELMELYGVGVQVEQVFTVKRVDEDFFD